MPTVDANCWIASLDPSDPFHSRSATFFQRVADRAVLLYGPEFVVVEVACALARKLHDSRRGHQAAAALLTHVGLRLYPHDERFMEEATRLGVRRFLRGADALYAATAQLTGTTLVSWDNELIERAGALTPTDWLNATP
jgi:predicted nucleic acid-binding protein